MTKPTAAQRRVSDLGLWAGLLIAACLIAVPGPQTLSDAAWLTVVMVVLMVIWWITEAVPIAVTSLVPLVVLPVGGVMPIAEAAVPYSSPIVLLLLGGFIIATSVERWNLHRRLALGIVVRAGEHPQAIVGGFMLAAALLSMWISNTATTIMLAPIALSVARAIVGPDRVGAPLTLSLLLGLAYGASIGGIATPVGTPTNLIVMAYLDSELGIEVGFADWLTLGLPVVVLLLPFAWLVVTRWAIRIEATDGRSGREVIARELASLGPMSAPERRVLVTFVVIAALWIFRKPLTALSFGSLTPFAGLTDHVIAIAGAIVLFLIPAGRDGERLLDWDTAVRIPWGVALLFGGGLSMAAAITKTGLAGWLGTQLAGIAALPQGLLIVALVLFVIFATELASNVATASALLPILGALAIAGGVDPVLLSVPVAMAASCAFMLPIATGPNAIAFSTGEVAMPAMARVGFMLNLLAVGLISTVLIAIGPLMVARLTG
ncbi:MAG: DASS family sodium-coupled anion symporter [Pseudomonadota bacterium]